MQVARRSVLTLSVILAGSLALSGFYLRWVRNRNPLGDLAAAVGSTMDFEPRLTGGFLPADHTSGHRSAGSATPDLGPDARIAIAQIEKRAHTDTQHAVLEALGVARLVEGDVDRSIATLEEAALTGDAPAWSDLSAAYLVKAQRTPARRIEYFARGLDAASHSLGLHPSDEARFNRALAIEAFSPYAGPLSAWTEYLQTEKNPQWISVARRHVVNTRSAESEGPTWEARRRALRQHLADADRPAIDETVRLFPEAALEFVDQDLILEWARAESAGISDRAAAALRQADILAQAIHEATQDPMARDSVRVIQAARRGPRSARLTLADAHLSYARAVQKFRADDYAGAMTAVETALRGFRGSRSPHWALAALQNATILFQQRDLGDSDQQLNAIEAFARRHEYATLLGRVLQQRGLTQSKQWRLTEALEAFRAAASCFEKAGEREHAAAVYSLIADALRSLGERHESWEYIGKTLDGLPHIRTPLRRYLILFNASLFASSQDLLEPALVFQNAALREATARGGGTVVEALTERATILARRHDNDGARRDVQEARRRLGPLPDGPLKRYQEAEMAELAAELRQTDQESLIAGLQHAVAFFSKAEPTFVPRLHLALARAHAAGGALDAAETSFAQGIAQLEGQQSRLGDDALKISYFDESWSLFPEMIDFQVSLRHDMTTAFEYAERSRARSLLHDVRPLRLNEIQDTLPESVALLYYVTLPNRLLIWTITKTGYHLTERAIRREDLSRLISRYRSEVVDAGAATSVAETLYDELIRPVVRAVPSNATLVIIADGELQRLPFAALRNPTTARYLIEERTLVWSPSATFFARALPRLRELANHRIESALLIGNPISSHDAAFALPPLPGAEAEAAASAAFYPRNEVLTGYAATKQRFVGSAAGYELVHFGGHAVANAEYPLLSWLSFSPDADTGQSASLFAYEISRIRFSRTRLVVLAACSTAAGAISRGEGVVSVARPFLAAGVPVVIASQWDVDDQATARLFREFHRFLAESQDEVWALRAAQLALLRSRDPQLTAPRSWGAFLALGTTLR
jgi:CHAT domain-containing protein